MSRDVRIRSAESQDIDAILPLFTAYRVFYGLEPRSADSWAYLAARLADGSSTILLAEDEDGAGLGFVQLYPSFDSLALAPCWIVYDLFIEPEARGHGIAEALMRAAHETAAEHGAVSMVLETAHDNLAAQALYAKLAYVRDTGFGRYALKLASS